MSTVEIIHQAVVEARNKSRTTQAQLDAVNKQLGIVEYKNHHKGGSKYDTKYLDLNKPNIVFWQEDDAIKNLHTSRDLIKEQLEPRLTYINSVNYKHDYASNLHREVYNLTKDLAEVDAKINRIWNRKENLNKRSGLRSKLRTEISILTKLEFLESKVIEHERETFNSKWLISFINSCDKEPLFSLTNWLGPILAKFVKGDQFDKDWVRSWGQL